MASALANKPESTPASSFKKACFLNMQRTILLKIYKFLSTEKYPKGHASATFSPTGKFEKTKFFKPSESRIVPKNRTRTFMIAKDQKGQKIKSLDEEIFEKSHKVPKNLKWGPFDLPSTFRNMKNLHWSETRTHVLLPPGPEIRINHWAKWQ